MHKQTIMVGIAATTIVGVLVYLNFRQAAFLAAQQRRIQFISSKLESRESLDPAQLVTLDGECAKQALQVFNEEKADFPKGVFASRANHYSRKRNKCFVYIEWTGVVGGVPESSRTLEDAFEHKVYATYFWTNTEGKKFWEVQPQISLVYPDGDTNNGHSCTSEAEFEEFVNKYMND